MKLRTDIANYLSGFENRMKFINISRCLTNYKYTDEVRALIPDKAILDNLVLGVFIFIKEKALGEDQICTIQDVEHFLEEFSPIIIDKDIKASFLARYIVITVLQNGGLLQEFTVFDSEKEEIVLQPIHLINETNGNYRLSDDAFDFLFRTKEIESELDYSVTRFRLNEYMKRDNYKEAVSQSRELIQKIRNMKRSIEDFLLRCREDITKIDVQGYEHIISSIRTLLENEDKELTDIQHAAQEKEKRLQEAQYSGVNADEMIRHQKALNEIVRNISTTINEQRALINRRFLMGNTYDQLLRDSLVVSRYESMSFEKDILAPLRQNDHMLNDAALRLLYPLLKPSLPKLFSLENFYAPQSLFDQEEEEDSFEIDDYEDMAVDNSAERNKRYLFIIEELFTYANKHSWFLVSDFIKDFKLSQLNIICEEYALPNVILRLYEMQEIDIDDWKQSEQLIIEPLGEFELSWCLKQLPEDLLNIHKIAFTKKDSIFNYSTESNGIKRSIMMNDYYVEVTK